MACISLRSCVTCVQIPFLSWFLGSLLSTASSARCCNCTASPPLPGSFAAMALPSALPSESQSFLPLQEVRRVELQGGTSGLSSLSTATSQATTSSFPPALRAAIALGTGSVTSGSGAMSGMLVAAASGCSQLDAGGAASSLTDRLSASQYSLVDAADQLGEGVEGSSPFPPPSAHAGEMVVHDCVGAFYSDHLCAWKCRCLKLRITSVLLLLRTLTPLRVGQTFPMA
jgi:hypothetical protein